MTSKFLKNIDLKSPEELIPLFDYILNAKNNIINGRIINSQSYLNNKNISLLELPHDVNTYYSKNYLLDENRGKIHKLYVGENVLGMSPKINKLIRDYNWDLSKYPSKGKN